MDDFLFTRSLPGRNSKGLTALCNTPLAGLQGTSTAAGGNLDKLLSLIPQSQLMFDSPIPEVSREGGFNLSKKTNSTGGPSALTFKELSKNFLEPRKS